MRNNDFSKLAKIIWKGNFLILQDIDRVETLEVNNWIDSPAIDWIIKKQVKKKDYLNDKKIVV